MDPNGWFPFADTAFTHWTASSEDRHGDVTKFRKSSSSFSDLSQTPWVLICIVFSQRGNAKIFVPSFILRRQICPLQHNCPFPRFASFYRLLSHTLGLNPAPEMAMFFPLPVRTKGLAKPVEHAVAECPLVTSSSLLGSEISSASAKSYYFFLFLCFYKCIFKFTCSKIHPFPVQLVLWVLTIA